MDSNEKRVANISIVVREKKSVQRINEILSRHGEDIRGRLGIPYPERGISIIVIIIDADNSRIGAISGYLGNVTGVTLRSTMLI